MELINAKVLGSSVIGQSVNLIAIGLSVDNCMWKGKHKMPIRWKIIVWKTHLCNLKLVSNDENH